MNLATLRKRCTGPVLLSLLWTTVSTLSVFADDSLEKGLESQMASMLDDHEFGLSSYISEAFVEIESSPDSLFWVQGTAKLKYFVDDRLEFRNAEWHLNPIDDSRDSLVNKENGRKLQSSLFDFKTCFRSMVKYKGVFYELEKLDYEGYRDQWRDTRELVTQSSCVTVDPMSWPFAYSTMLSRGEDRRVSLMRTTFVHNLCAKATQIDSRTVQSIWFNKATTPDGRRLMFKDITFKDGLPTVTETFSYQAGFRDLAELPDRKQSILINHVETTWTRIDDVPVPEKVVARLHNAGFEEVNELIVKVKLKYWNAESKEYAEMKSIADKALVEIEKLEVTKK
jgi:hypothetical protein